MSTNLKGNNMTRKNFMLTSAVLFAAAGGATTPKTAPETPVVPVTPVTATTPKTAPETPVVPVTPVAATAAKVKKEKPEITVVGVSDAVPMPARKGGKRGNKSVYDLSGLKVGQSLAIIGRKATNLTSTISTNNRADEFATFKLDDAGNKVFVQEPVKDAAGNVVGHKPGAPIVVSRRVFFTVDCDPSKDPEKADVRIFRDADKIEKTA